MSSLLGALGFVSLLFALAGFAMALFGAAPLGWSIFHGILGVLLLASSAAINLDALRERVASGEARRAGKYGSSSLISALLVIAMLGMGGFLANRYSKRFDWSEQGVHSLSDQTLKVLAALEDDVEVLALFSRVNWEPVRDQLDRYAYASDRFDLVEIADPNEKPQLLERYGIAPEQLGQGIVHLRYRGESVNVDEPTEEALTNAIVKLTRTGDKTVYFLEGHGEKPIDGEKGLSEEGFQRAAEALRNENYKVEKLLLAAVGEVPEDADVVIAAGPTRQMLDEERTALARYLERGGALLALIDPRIQTEFVAQVEGWGIELADDIVLDRELALFGRATTPFAQQYAPDHPITQAMQDYTMFHVARSVRAQPDTENAFTELVLTGRASWAERDVERFVSDGRAEIGEEDLVGPVPVAIAGELSFDASDGSSVDARVAVFGDSDFASNQLLGTYQNRNLFVNTVNWLLGDVESISVRPNRSRGSSLSMTAAQRRIVQILALFAIPEALAVVGVFIWWTRRQPARR